MTSRKRIVLLAGLLAGGVGPLGGQTTQSIMVGTPPAGRDVALDRGFLIAKGTTLPQGRGYVDALAPTLTVGVAYGVTDRLTAQAGTTLWTIADAPSLYGSARYGVIKSKSVNVALGALGVVIVDENETSAGGWPYVTTTVEAGRVSVTGLLGVGSSTEVFESSFTGQLLLQGGLEVFMSSALEVVVEALYLGEGTDPVAAIGMRGFAGPFALEAGLVHAFEVDAPDNAALPWAGVSWRF